MIIPKKNHCPKCGAFVGTAVCNNMLCLEERKLDMERAAELAVVVAKEKGTNDN